MVRRLLILAILLIGFLPRLVANPDMVPVVSAAPIHIQQQATTLDVVQEAYDDFLDHFSQPLQPAQLLDDAWSGITQALGSDTPSLPALPTDRAGAWSTFAPSYLALESGVSDPTGLADAAIRGMVKARQNCHTVFYSANQFQQVRASLSHTSEAVGLGVEWSRDPSPAAVWIYPDSPAQAAGIEVGDTLLAIDGVPFGDGGQSQTARLLRPPAGIQEDLTLQQPSGATVDVTMAAAPLAEPDFQATILPDGVGLMRLRAFADDSGIGEQLRQTLNQFNSSGVSGWILDLRENGGGSSATGTDVASKFLPAGTHTLGIENATGAQEWAVADGTEVLDQKPLAILVDHATASMSEITTGALQLNGRARVFGQQTLGCVNGGDLYQLADGSGLFLSIFRAQIGPDAFEPEGKGITPDQKTDVAIEPPASDPAVAAASAYVLGATDPEQPPIEQAGRLQQISELVGRGLTADETPDGFKLVATGVHPNEEAIAVSDDPNLPALFTSEGRQTGYDSTFIKTAGEGGVFTGPSLTGGYSLYTEATGAHRAMDLYGELLSYRFITSSKRLSSPELNLGEETAEITGTATTPDAGNFTFTLLAWRRGNVFLYVMSEGPPGTEPSDQVAAMAQALDARYLSDPLP